MKRTKNLNGFKILLLQIVLLLGVGDAWGVSTTYYSALKAQVSSSGGGKVYAGTSTTAGTYAEGTSTSSNQSSTTQNEEKSFYAFAKANDGYSFTGWSSTDGGSIVSTANPYQVSVKCSSSSSGSPTTTTVFANFAENTAISVNFVPGTNGSYTVNGTKISTSPSQAITCEGAVALVATPASGYKFFGWYTSSDGGTTKSYFSHTASTSYTFLTAATVYAEFIVSSVATFTVKGTSEYYYDFAKGLTAAKASSSKVLVVASNGSVAAGSYTIPSGVTLLVPYEDTYAVNTTPSTVTSGTPSRSTYRTLTLANGVIINVNGSICVNAKMCLTMGYNGSAMDKYGLMDMKSGSQIKLNNGANCYVWGFIIGDGTITAESGSVLHETFQFKHRGGNALSSIASTNASKKVFPINQYYIQSIEVAITIKKGATEKVYTGVHNSSTPVSIDFIGTSGLFNMTGTDAYLVKRYDVSKDRQEYSLYGNATIGSIKFGMSGFYKESKDFVLPITNNMTLNVESGTTTIQYETAILPDVQISIASGAKIATSNNCYVYDSIVWKGAYAYANDYSAAEKAQIVPVVYRHGGLQYNRKNYKLRDAMVDVKGELSGSIYTTTGGANIISSGSGIVTFPKARTATSTNQAGQDGTTGKFDEIAIASAQLHNSATFKTAYGDEMEYLATAGTSAGTTVQYANGHWGWVEVWKNGTAVLAAANTVKKVNNATAKNALIASVTVPENYEIVSGDEWETTVDETNQEVVHTLKIVPVVYYTITWDLANGSAKEYTSVKAGEKPTHDTPEKASTEQWNYTFFKWACGEQYYTTEDLPVATGNATYKATYNASVRKYTVIWKHPDGTVLSSEPDTYQYGEQPKYKGATPTYSDGKKLYAFSGWRQESTGSEFGKDDVPDPIGGDETYTALFDVVAVLIIEEDKTYDADVEVETTMVRVQGTLNVEGSATLTTNELFLEGSDGASGEIVGKVSAAKAYFDLSHEGGFKARTWYAVAVPWQVDVKAYAEDNGVYIVNGNATPLRQQMGITFDLIYYDGARRAKGVSKAWNFVEKDHEAEHIMYPGRAYMIYLTSDADVIRFERKAGAELHTNSLQLTKYPVSAGVDETYADWNGIANPATYHAFLNVGATDGRGQVYNAETKQYSLFEMNKKKLVVGQPIFVQPAEGKTVIANKEAYKSAFAPRLAAKAASALTRYELYLAPSLDIATDQIVVRMSEYKEEDVYTVGQDLVKMGVSDLVPQMWIDRYENKMCIHTVAPTNNSADYPLGIFVPKSGEYDLFLDDEPDSESTLYLTYDGEAIWNLSDGAYVANLEKGTNTHYGLRIVGAKAPEMTTGIDEAVVDAKGATRKVIINETVYIIRGDKVYSAEGQLVR